MRSHCSSANLPSCSGSSSRARSKSRWRRRPDATFRLATGQLLQSFRVPSPFHLISLTLSKLALWSANLPLSDEVRNARQPNTICYVNTKHIYESLTSFSLQSKCSFEMWDKALDRQKLWPVDCRQNSKPRIGVSSARAAR